MRRADSGLAFAVDPARADSALPAMSAHTCPPCKCASDVEHCKHWHDPWFQPTNGDDE